MADLQATLALLGVSKANFKHQNEKSPLKVKNVLIPSRVFLFFIFNEHTLFVIGSLHTTAKKQRCI